MSILNKGAVLPLIDALPDANGNPPRGYAWMDGVISGAYTQLMNRMDALTDAASSGGTHGVTCADGEAYIDIYSNGLGADINLPTLGYINGTHTFYVPPEAPVKLRGLRELPDGTALVLYTRGASLCAVTFDTAGAVVQSAELALTDTFQTDAVQQVALVDGYALIRFYSLDDGGFDGHWAGFKLSDGSLSLLSTAEGSGSIGYTGEILAASGSHVLTVSTRYDSIVRHRALSIVTGEEDQVFVSSRSLVAPYTESVSAAVAADGSFVVHTAQGWFDVSQDGSTVAHVAGPHPLMAGAVASWLALSGNVLLAGYFGTTPHFLNADYAAMKAGFIRKAVKA